MAKKSSKLTNTPSVQPRSKTSGARSMAELMLAIGPSIQPIQKGDIARGTVKKLTSQEILLDIGAKGDALVIEYDKKNLENLLKLLKVGDQVHATVISAESEGGFPVVSLRRMLDEVLLGRLKKLYEDRAALEVKVVEVTRGGFFVETEESVRGFLPNSQVVSEHSLGRTIQVKIIELDQVKKRIIFSEKATIYTIDPKEIEKYIKKKEKVSSRVTNVTPYGIFVTITPKEGILIEGFIHISEVSHQRVDNLSSLFAKDQVIEAEVVDIDQENRRVNLSLKSFERDKFEEAREKYKTGEKVKGVVRQVRTRGVTLDLPSGVLGFIPGAKLPTDVTYTIGESVAAEVSDIDEKRKLIIMTPILKVKPIGYR